MERKEYWKKLSKADGAETEELIKAEEALPRASAKILNENDFESLLNRK